MKWTLKEVRQETCHPFLNFYTLIYDVTKEDGSHSLYSYYLASRREKEELRAITKEYERPDGVLLPLYYVDPDSQQISFLLTTQFRPAIGRYCTSFVAGLLDRSDTDILDAVRREAKEESGCQVDDLELIAPPAPTSSGLSDEINCIVLGRITSFGEKHLEEYEDIKTKLYSLQEIQAMLENPDFYFPINIRILLLYFLGRFLKENECSVYPKIR